MKSKGNGEKVCSGCMRMIKSEVMHMRHNSMIVGIYVMSAISPSIMKSWQNCSANGVAVKLSKMVWSLRV